jgi:hypothetical protein
MYSSEDEIERVVRGFETCETDKDEFKHRDHVTVAVWYLQSMDREAAVERMRTGLLRFLAHHGVAAEKYSETVTVYWIELIAEKLGELRPDTSLLRKCNYILSLPIHTPAAPVANEA